MPELSATQLADSLNLSKGRISQYVKEGRLAGCFRGEGRARRFDLAKVAAKLGRELDPGQLMGNGSDTKKRLRDLQGPGPAPISDTPLKESGSLPEQDVDRYELARIQKAEEEAKKLRRQNQLEEGNFLLAAEVHQQVTKLVGQEVAAFESMLRDGARKIADELGVDYRTTRQILMLAWRDHRGQRSDQAQVASQEAEMTDAETEQDF